MNGAWLHQQYLREESSYAPIGICFVLVNRAEPSCASVGPSLNLRGCVPAQPPVLQIQHIINLLPDDGLNEGCHGQNNGANAAYHGRLEILGYWLAFRIRMSIAPL